MTLYLSTNAKRRKHKPLYENYVVDDMKMVDRNMIKYAIRLLR